ncbi:MAG: hypothetical protein K5839_07205 [Treponemataceae bacterium]|nr:hypothetical protein [Treponemataceae bacterium]
MKKIIISLTALLLLTGLSFAQEKTAAENKKEEVKVEKTEKAKKTPKAKSFEEGVQPKDKFYIGDYALIQSRKVGGGISAGIPIFQKNAFFIKDEISANLYFSSLPKSEGMMISLCDKIQFGSIKEYNGYAIRSYGYMKCVFGITKDESYAFFQSPMILEMGGAGGFEFLFCPSKGFFVEFGGGCAIKSWGQVDKADAALGCFDGSYVCITTGVKHYF